MIKEAYSELGSHKFDELGNCLDCGVPLLGKFGKSHCPPWDKQTDRDLLSALEDISSDVEYISAYLATENIEAALFRIDFLEAKILTLIQKCKN